MRAAPPARRIAPALRLAVLRASLLAATCVGARAAAQDLGPLPELSRQGTLDRTGEGRVRVAWELPDATVYPGQLVTLALVAELDEGYLANHMVQPFTRRLDVPIAFDEPPLELERVVDFGADTLDGARLAFGERVVRAAESTRVARDAGDVRRLRVEARVRASAPRDEVLPAPILRFASADAFREELLGRTPIDARLALVRGREATLRVAPFPEPGRAPDFDGLIGEFTVRAAVEPREVRLGDVVRVRLDVEGPVPVDDDRLPQIDELRGLHQLSRRVTPTPEGARVEVELRVERASVRAIPAIELHSFLPSTATYAVARTEPVPLHVLAAEHAPEPPEARPSWSVWVSVAAGLLIAVVVAARRRRGGRRARE